MAIAAVAGLVGMESRPTAEPSEPWSVASLGAPLVGGVVIDRFGSDTREAAR
ncbi:hypothetical protein OIE63_09275 [Streptomyces sp. NBC_01795]|uniref:hypothetical protein n=1 Tax=unclassified Streptomyces TaxID=2593676 RepID=UPI002DD84534|nr:MULTISPECIES: hypothetical protein [unclassified Streptomyces]WSA91727.1 hypothetical protein OIE63_09275 [Streptomyces sp. NBC_01795]WSS15629.1 hypothetical protein OG533_29850 [Streptomyces sp. NBC_01186]